MHFFTRHLSKRSDHDLMLFWGPPPGKDRLLPVCNVRLSCVRETRWNSKQLHHRFGWTGNNAVVNHGHFGRASREEFLRAVLAASKKRSRGHKRENQIALTH